MKLETEPYQIQNSIWPEAGRVILANYDRDTIVVYQAYRPAIGHFAARHGYFGGEFKLSRMSWIKPNFLWMMYRCGWASKQGQEVVLAIRIQRAAFDSILSQAVYSSYKPDLYASREAWKDAVATSNVRLQWDPDHSPDGEKLQRRAVQLGLRGEVLRKYSRDWIVEITDVSGFVREQRVNSIPSRYEHLLMPRERVYPVSDTRTIKNLRLDSTLCRETTAITNQRLPGAAELTSIVSDLLWRDWDPIGINEQFEARDEYNSYVGTICSLLLSGADARKIRDHLAHVETVNMGLSSPCPHLDEVVRKLLALVGR